MSFKVGRQKTGGRQIGTPNKRTSHLVDVLNEMDVDPVRAIMELLPALEPKEQVDVYRDLMTYLYPKRKAIEHNHNIESITINEMSDEELEKASYEAYLRAKSRYEA